MQSRGKSEYYYPFIGITQGKVNMDGLVRVARLWYIRPSKHARDSFMVRKVGEVVSSVIFPTLLPQLLKPKREEAEFIIKHGSPVHYNVKEEYLRTFPHAKGRRFVVKGSQDVWLDAVMTVTPTELSFDAPAVIYLEKDGIEELEYLDREELLKKLKS